MTSGELPGSRAEDAPVFHTDEQELEKRTDIAGGISAETTLGLAKLTREELAAIAVELAMKLKPPATSLPLSLPKPGPENFVG